MASKPKQQSAPAQQVAAPPPPMAELQTTGWGNMGPQIPQNPMGMGTPETGQGVTPPSWAQGNFAMPWWGQQAPNVGQAILQQQNPDAYGGGGGDLAAAAEAAGLTEEEIRALIQAELAKQAQAQAQQQQNPYAGDRDWMQSIGVPGGLDRYSGQQSPFPGAMSQEDQQWLQANHPWAASRG